MSDFKKKADPPAPTDDYSPVPFLGGSVVADVPAIDDDQDEDDGETDKRAAPYWHPAWEHVQEIFEDFLEIHGTNSAELHADVPAEEFKIRMLVDARAAALVENLMEDVKRAVEQVESRPKPAKQSKPGE